MLKSVYCFGLLSLISITNFAQNRSIKFEPSSFKEIKEKALKENKLIFIDAFTTWCGPCKQMAKNIFTNDTVADYYNKNFVNAKIDMEKGEGIELAKQYDVRCYPNLLFVDGNGNLVHRIAGSMSVKEFVALAEVTKIPEKCFSNFTKNYEANKMNSDFLSSYIEARENTCIESENLINDYFSLQQRKDLITKKNWAMIKSYVNSVESKEFDYVITNKDQFEKAFDSREVNDKIEQVYAHSLMSLVKESPFDESKYKNLKEKMSSLGLPNTKFILFETDLALAEKNADWTSYAQLAIDNVEMFYLEDANILNAISWNFYEKVENKNALSKAEEWAMRACEIESSYANLDTYASVLYKLGKKQQATDIANKAINTAKKDKLMASDYQGTIDLLKKIKELK